MKQIQVEVTGADVGQIYRQLRVIAEHVREGHHDGVMDGGPDGDWEYHLHELEDLPKSAPL